MLKTKSDTSNAQMILLSGFMIMLGSLTFLVLLNNLILTANLPTSGLDISKQDVKEFRSLTISEVKYATEATLQYSEDYDITNEILLCSYFKNHTKAFSESLSSVFATRGTSVELIVNNVTFNSSITNRTITIQHYSQRPHFFPNTSLIIPMDSRQNNTLQIYRFVWDIVNNTSVPVYSILQNPVNMTNISSNPTNMTNISYHDFYLNLTTNDEPLGAGNVSNRTYSGGAFMIDISDTNTTTINWIHNESCNFAPPITMHRIWQDGGILLERTVRMRDVPSVAIYPDTSPDPLATYYSDMLLPYTLLNDSDILMGTLTLENYSVLLIHYNMSCVDANITSAIVNWTADGGVLYAECIGAVTMDRAVEAVDNNTDHSWYGFIGINETNLSSISALIPDGPYIKLINSSSILNDKSPMQGLIDGGASFNPLSQTSNTSGMFGPARGYSTGERGCTFTLNNTTDAVNPDTNIIGYASYSNGSQIILNKDNESDYHFTYVEAPFERGRVIYMAGHNLSSRGIHAQRIAAEIFYSSVSREELALEANNINVTILYSDGRAHFADTFFITL